MKKMLENGAVVVSLDVELAWGYHGHHGDNNLSQDGAREREIIHKLIELFDRTNAPVTWAVTGHLFLEQCDGTHSDVLHPQFPESDVTWYQEDPGTTQEEAPLWYGPDIVAAILDANVNHEIGTHTFSHLNCNHPGTTAEVLRSELQKCKELAEANGCKLSSIIFPSNEINHLDTVASEGIKSYRGTAPGMSRTSSELGWRINRFLYFLWGHSPPPLTEPEETIPGLWNVPASQYLGYPHPSSPLHRTLSRFPTHPSVRQAKQAIRSAKRKQKIYHLWAHPHEFDDWMISNLELILNEARRQSVPLYTMDDVIRVVQGERPRLKSWDEANTT